MSLNKLFVISYIANIVSNRSINNLKSLFLQLFYFVLQNLRSKNKRHRHTPPKNGFWERGTYTIEAAVCMPVFVCLCVFILLFFRILTLQWGIEASLYEVARQSALMGEVSGFEPTVSTLSAASTAMIKKNGVPTGYIKGDIFGLDYSESKVTENEILLSVSYDVNVPIGFFGRYSWRINQQNRARRWVGYDPNEDRSIGSDVYVTEHGSAYHNSTACVYLNPSIRVTTASIIDTKRNLGGAKYVACDRCHPTKSGILYITEYGNVYHDSVSCSSLKRSVMRISMENAIEEGYHSCSKCGG